MTSVDLKPLKRFAKSNLSACPILRQLLLEEQDNVYVEDFLWKSQMWLKILELENPRGDQTS